VKPSNFLPGTICRLFKIAYAVFPNHVFPEFHPWPASPWRQMPWAASNEAAMRPGFAVFAALLTAALFAQAGEGAAVDPLGLSGDGTCADYGYDVRGFTLTLSLGYAG
jgi:hypothetical protein